MDGPGIFGINSGSAICCLWVYRCCQGGHCTEIDVRGICHRCKVQASRNDVVEDCGKEGQ